MAQNGGGMAVEELEKLNLVAVARNLLSGNTGTVTPYGVLYDEGFSLEHIYDEGMIPPFYNPLAHYSFAWLRTHSLSTEP